LTQEQVGPFCTVFLPMLLATILLTPFVYRMLKNGHRPKITDLGTFFLLALIGQFPAQVLMTIGTQQSTASNASIINLSLPVVSALLAFFILGEKMNLLRWVCFAVSIIGVILCSSKDFQGSHFSTQYITGNALIFCGVIGSGLYNTICKKMSKNYSEIEMLFYTYIFMLLLLTPIVVVYERDTLQNISSFTTQTIVGLSLLTIFHNFLSMILFFTALKNLEAIQVALSNFLITFFGLPIAVFLLHEKVGVGAVFGGLLVITSTLVITVYEYRQMRGSTSVQ
jgi:drug/metabolite transporter (DMT)-like permease